ncbi:MAG: response regulator [Pirellulales bacterium]
MSMILVVDDDRLVRTMLENCLRNAGHAVLLATNGQEGLKLLREHSVNAIILDMNMPELDGWSTAVFIRQELGMQLPILAYSAYKLEGDKARALGAGCTHFLPKPIDVGQFMETLSHALGSKTLPPQDHPPSVH